MKRCLRKVLGNARLSFDELYTVLTEVENILNCRPLTYLYDELGTTLTPSHLIYGYRMSSLSEGIDPIFDNDDVQDKLTKRLLYLTRKLFHFWSKWQKEYITDSREFHKLKANHDSQIQVGQLVLLQEDNLKRCQWKTAIIEELVTGQDGEVRGAIVCKSGKGKPEILSRPLQRLIPLEISCRDNDKKEGKGEITSETCDEVKENGEKSGLEYEREPEGRPTRTAAKDARWRTRLILDP